MNAAFSPNLPRIAAFALAVGVCALGGLALIKPYEAFYQSGNDEIRSLEKRLQQYRAAAASRPEFVRQIERIKQDPDIRGQYLKSATPALAGAELQQNIQKLIERHGARLVSMQIVEETRRQDSNVVTVRIRMQAELPAFRDLLFALESGHPLVMLDNVSVRLFGSGRGNDGSQGALDIGFDASAYLLGQAT